MKRLLCLAGAVLATSGCFDFDKRLADCRDDAGSWRCGTTGTDGGPLGPDGGRTLVLPDRVGLVCQHGWCWEHPRPAGHDLKAIWGTSETDLWVGGMGGLLAHWDGARWTNQELPLDLQVRALCGHDGEVFAGMGHFGSGNSTETLFRLRQGTWSRIDAPQLGFVTGLSCGSRLLVSHFGGLSAAEWSNPVPRVILPVQNQMEAFSAVLETGPNDCLVASHENGGESFTRIQRCDGGLEWASAQGISARVEGLWRDEVGAVYASVSGVDQVLRQDGGAWWPVYQGDSTHSVLAGIPFNAGALAVGPRGTVVQLPAEALQAAPRTTTIVTKRNSDLAAVFRPDGGAPLAVGEWGCITGLTDVANDTWTVKNDCAAEFLDVSFGPRLLALTDRAVWERGPAGWSVLQQVNGARRGLREQQDGGLVFLTDSSLVLGELSVLLNVSDAQAFELVSDELAVVVTGGGQLIEVTLPQGGKRLAVASGASGLPVVDEQGAAWVRGPDGEVFMKRPGAADWVTEQVSTGALTDLAVGPGKVWALRDSSVYWRSTSSPGWTSLDAPAAYTRLAPLSADEVLLIDEGDGATRLTSGGNALPASIPPKLISSPLAAKGGEAWGLTAAGELLRFKP